MSRLALAALLLAPALLSAQDAAVTSGRANLRAQPSATAPVLRALPAAARVRVLGRSGEWTRVDVGGATGWVHRSLLREQASAAAAGTPATSSAPPAAPESSLQSGVRAAPPATASATSGGSAGGTRRGDAKPASARPAGTTGFEPGHLFVGPRTWLGVYGTVSVGGQAEIAASEPGRVGPGVLGVGLSADVYHYGQRWAYGEWSATVIPVGAYANYHIPVGDRRFDPYVGGGVGFALVSGSWRVLDQQYDTGVSRSSGLYTLGHVGGRYFVRPNLAVQAETGWGIGALSIGVTWKR